MFLNVYVLFALNQETHTRILQQYLFNQLLTTLDIRRTNRFAVCGRSTPTRNDERARVPVDRLGKFVAWKHSAKLFACFRIVF